MADPTLRLAGRPVAVYPDGHGLDPTRAPRPHLHPIRTLGGTAVTAAEPPDHPWHLGFSVAVQDVDGANFWGGPTFLPGRGYTWRADHGSIERLRLAPLEDGFAERLRWVTASGEPLIAEERRVHARLVEHGWEIALTTTLTNATPRPLRLGSPATNGRDGAGYGGLFWRLPPAVDPRVRTANAHGEAAVHGTVAPWLAWTDAAAGFALVFAPADDATGADPWFVRASDYPGVGSQLAARLPVVLPVGGAVARGLRVLVADDALDDRAAATWAEGG